MTEQWEARGPDEFGDFTVSSKGEELAKCVVVQNGFRTPAETKQIAEQLIRAVNSHDALVKALGRSRIFVELASDIGDADDIEAAKLLLVEIDRLTGGPVGTAGVDK